MTKDKLAEQSEAVNQAFHQIWFAVMISRADFKKDIQNLSFIEKHLINMAYTNPDFILKDIRKRLDIPQTTLSSMVAKLEKLGYVRRVINRRDMRSFSLELTDRGRKMQAEHTQRDLEQARQIVLSLDKDEREPFVRLFRKVADGIARPSQTG